MSDALSAFASSVPRAVGDPAGSREVVRRSPDSWSARSADRTSSSTCPGPRRRDACWRLLWCRRFPT